MYKLALLSIIFFSAAYADDVVCKKCQVIREYNESHPENNYYWYDDYLKDQKAGDSKKLNADKPNPSTIHACGCGKKKKNPNNA